MTINFQLPSIFPRTISWLHLNVRNLFSSRDNNKKQKVLVLGIYLADRANTVEHIVSEFGSSANYTVDQKWIALFGNPSSPEVNRVTVKKALGRKGKFTFINYLLAITAWRLYDWVIVCDDDITLPPQFLDHYLGIQTSCDFALAQPARTHNSYVDHAITEVRNGSDARETRFVEIGPLFSVSKNFIKHIAPFDERAPMGFGLDWVWPYVAETHGFKLGIVDATPVDHSIRKPGRSYDAQGTWARMLKYLARVPHLPPDNANVIIREYPAGSVKHS